MNLLYFFVLLLPSVSLFEVSTFNDYCLKCTYFNYVLCYYNNKCFSEDPKYCLKLVSNMVDCKTTADTPLTYTIMSTNVGVKNFGAKTEYISPDTYVIFVFQNLVGNGLPGRVRLHYSDNSLKFYKA